jgi:putative flippase GtrA
MAPGVERLPEFVRFIGLGAIAALANYLSRFLFDAFLPFEAAVAAAYVLGMTVAFYMFRTRIFGDAGDGLSRQAVRFTMVNIVGVVIAVSVSAILARLLFPNIGWTFYPYASAHAVGIAVPAVTSYFGHKYYTFRTPRMF